MSLSDYTPETRTVPLGKTTLTIQGLSFEGIAVLLREHFPDLETLYEIFQKSGSVSSEQFGPIALALVSQAPGLAANMIAIAAGEPESAPSAAKISAPKQAEILITIMSMTFEEVGGVGKALEIIAPLLVMKTQAMAKITKTKTKVP